MQVHQRAADFDAVGFERLAVGFSPPAALAELAAHVGWPDRIVSDEDRRLYDRLGVRRTSLRRVFNAGTLVRYGRSLRGGATVRRPVEDIRQLGADVLVVEGVALLLARPRTPDDRPSADELLAGARRLAGRD